MSDVSEKRMNGEFISPEAAADLLGHASSSEQSSGLTLHWIGEQRGSVVVESACGQFALLSVG